MKLLFVILIATFVANKSIVANNKPNVVVLLSDDQAWTDYGFMGHSTIKTPHLDKLVERSILFSRGYVASPLCRPSLASIMTGRFPFDHGITGNDVDGRNKRAELDIPLRKNFYQFPNFISTLTNHGYLAHQSGKFWEGSYQDGGFTHGMTHGNPNEGGRHGDVGLTIGREGMQPISDFIDFATEQKKPFLIWYAPFLPHTPHNPPQCLLDKYMAPDRALDVAKYYAMCEWFDETCGQLFGYLERKNLTENTLILYICDNGWAARSTNADDPHQKHWKDYALASKGSPFEKGIRSPIIVSWPRLVAAKKSEHFAHAIDFFPTILAAAKIEASSPLPGVNLLDEQAVNQRNIVFGVCNSVYNISIGDPDETTQYVWAIEGKWKLIVRHSGKDTTEYAALHRWDTKALRLYNVVDDPHEMKEISADHPEIVSNLKAKIEAWHKVQQ
jgi:arylsulfatase A-like enzyme